MDEDRLVEVLNRLDRGQQEIRREQQEARQQALDFRTAVMSRFERLEDKVSGLAASVALNVQLVGSILDQLTAREAQLGLLQDAIRAGINAESIQVRTMQKTLTSMNTLVLQLQSQLADLTQRLDEVRPQGTSH